MSLVESLLRTGGDVNARDSSKRTTLHLACESDHEGTQRVVNALLRARMEVNAQDESGVTPQKACRKFYQSLVVTQHYTD